MRPASGRRGSAPSITCNSTRLRHQQAQIARGEAPDNHLNPDLLNRLDRRILKEALGLAKGLQTRLALDYRL